MTNEVPDQIPDDEVKDLCPGVRSSHPTDMFHFLSLCAPVSHEMIHKKVTVGKKHTFSPEVLDFQQVYSPGTIPSYDDITHL